MANQFYGRYTKSAAATATAASSTFGAQLLPSSATSFASRSSLADSDTYSSHYLDSAVANPLSDYTSMYSSTSRFPSSSFYSLDQDPVLSALKRPSEAFYHPTVLGSHNTIGQNDWLTTSYLKRPRLENASHLPIYPQRPGEKDCAHYMLTRTCKFGESCKFDHPIWVPEGGIPDWKEVLPVNPSPELLPERPGEPDCPYFLKTQRCKFGVRCKFNHPKNQVVSSDVANVDVPGLPDRPSEPPCAFYLKTGLCKFGSTCKFHHPKDIQIASAGQENGSAEQSEHAIMNLGLPTDLKSGISVMPAVLHNSKGLPIRPGEVDCPFYLKTGSCKYSSTCRYNHPERTAINPPAAGIGHTFVAPSAASLGISVVNPAISVLQTVDPRLAPSALGFAPAVYPQRPGQMECDFYMKTGVCKFGEKCRYNHPIDRSTPSSKQETVKLTLAGLPRRELGFAPAVYPQRPGQMECDFYMKTGVCKFGEKCRYNHPIDRSTPSSKQETVKLTLAGLPRREGAIICPYYMKTSTCKYGATCKFDHPPPGEVMAMASVQGTTTTDGESKANE